MKSEPINYKSTGHVDIDQIIKSIYCHKPFYAFVLMELKRVYTTDKNLWLTAGSLSKEIIIHKENFAKITYEEKMAVVEHEVLHFALLHFTRFIVQLKSIEFKEIANLALDCAINQMIKLKLPKNVISLEYVRELCKDPNLLPNESADYYYDAMMKRRDEIKKEIESNPEMKKLLQAISDGHMKSIEKSCGVDGHIDPIMESAMRSILNNAKEKQDELDRHNGMNKGDYFSKILPSYVTDYKKNLWRNLIKRVIGQTPSAEIEMIYGRINRRIPESLFGNKRLLMNNHIYIVLDSSYSISDEHLQAFTGTTSKALKSESLTATMITCDYEVQEVKENVTNISMKREFQVSGRGGTDLTHALDYINKRENGKQCNVLVFTDGETPWKDYPNLKVNVIYTADHTKLSPKPYMEAVLSV